MEKITLIVYQNQEIKATDYTEEPNEPMHSGYLTEEREIMNNYYKRIWAYREKIDGAITCKNKELALRLLNEQYPNRIIYPHIRFEYTINGTNLHQLGAVAEKV